MTKYKNTYLVHTFVLSIYPILFLYSNNIQLVSFSEIVYPVAFSLLSTVFLLYLVKLVLKNWLKAGIVVSLLLVSFFMFGHIYSISPSILGRRFYTLVILFILIFVIPVSLLFFYLKTSSRKFVKLTVILNATSLVLVSMPVISILYFLVDERGSEGLAGISNEKIKQFTSKGINITRGFPDIYYIILDAHARMDTLEELYGYSDNWFSTYLEDNEFYIAEESRSNYLSTNYSLASSLNMQFIHNQTTKEVPSEHASNVAIQNNTVARFLKHLGYTYVYIGTGSAAVVQQNKYADISILKRRVTEFDTLLLNSTLLFPFTAIWDASDLKESIQYGFENLRHVPEMQTPTFTFAHFLIPHDPFVFQANGKAVKIIDLLWRGSPKKRKKLYVDQLIYANKEIQKTVNLILKQSEVPPVIIIQGDHGPYPNYRGQFNSRHTGENDNYKLHVEILKERMRIFNTYFLPGGGSSLLYPSITPVNTFRIVLNYYFNTSYKILSDKSYAHDYAGYGNQFIDVTDKIID